MTDAQAKAITMALSSLKEAVEAAATAKVTGFMREGWTVQWVGGWIYGQRNASDRRWVVLLHPLIKCQILVQLRREDYPR